MSYGDNIILIDESLIRIQMTYIDDIVWLAKDQIKLNLNLSYGDKEPNIRNAVSD